MSAGESNDDNSLLISDIQRGPGGYSFEVLDESKSAGSKSFAEASDALRSPQAKIMKRISSSVKRTPARLNISDSSDRFEEASRRRDAIQSIKRQKASEMSTERVSACRKRKSDTKTSFADEIEKKMLARQDQVEANRERVINKRKEVARLSSDRIALVKARKQEHSDNTIMKVKCEFELKMKKSQDARDLRLLSMKKRLSEHRQSVERKANTKRIKLGPKDDKINLVDESAEGRDDSYEGGAKQHSTKESITTGQEVAGQSKRLNEQTIQKSTVSKETRGLVKDGQSQPDNSQKNEQVLEDKENDQACTDDILSPVLSEKEKDLL